MKVQTEYFSYKQAMKYLSINSYDTLRKLIKSGLPTIQLGSTKRISKTAIDEFMEKHTIQKS